MRAIKFIIGMVFLFVIIVLGTANNEEVSLNYWADKPILGYERLPLEEGAVAGAASAYDQELVPIKVNLWKIIFLFFMFGFLVAYIMLIQDVFSLKSQLRKTRKALNHAEEELDRVRASTGSAVSPDDAASQGSANEI